MSNQTNMRREINEIPAAIDRLLTQGDAANTAAAEALAARDPAFFISAARGSSDHAATYFKYCSELLAGVPVASVGPSVASIYGRPLKLQNSACLAVSQSGKSPDIVSLARMAQQQGSLAMALTNHADSDLAAVCDHTLNLHAGVEKSVAATKTFATSLVSGIWLIAKWQGDTDLLAALHDLPKVLDRAVSMDWGALRDSLSGRNSLYCLGRGPAYAIAGEAALKFKETCLLHAESYSSAEVLHGPVSIVEPGFPVIALTAADPAEQSLVGVADQMADKGASVFVTSDMPGRATPLPVARSAHSLLDPISLIVSFYGMVEQVALARGINPDEPRHLKKVTETV